MAAATRARSVCRAGAGVRRGLRLPAQCAGRLAAGQQRRVDRQAGRAEDRELDSPHQRRTGRERWEGAPDLSGRAGRWASRSCSSPRAIARAAGPARSDVIAVDQAVDFFSQKIRLEPKDPFPFAMMALLREDKSEHDLAIRNYNEAIRLDPQSAASFAGRATAWYSKREFDKAIADFDTALRSRPEEHCCLPRTRPDARRAEPAHPGDRRFQRGDLARPAFDLCVRQPRSSLAIQERVCKGHHRLQHGAEA